MSANASNNNTKGATESTTAPAESSSPATAQASTSTGEASNTGAAFSVWEHNIRPDLKKLINQEALDHCITNIELANPESATPTIRLSHDRDFPKKRWNNRFELMPRTYEEVFTEFAARFGMKFEFVDVKPVVEWGTSVWDGFGEGLLEEWRPSPPLKKKK